MKKHKNKANRSIASLEVLCEKFIKLSVYRQEFESYEERIKDFVRNQIGNLQANITSNQVNINQVKEEAATELEQVKKETVWRIKQCEDLLEKRISKQEAIDMNISTEKNIKNQMAIQKDQVEQTIYKAHRDTN